MHENIMEFESKAQNAESEGDYLSAIEYYLQAIEPLKKVDLEENPSFNVGTLYARLATLYTEMGKFDAAIDHYKNAIKIYQWSNETLLKIIQHVGECYTSLGACFLAKADYMSALEYFNKAIEYTEKYIKMEEPDSFKNVVECKIFILALLTLCLFNLDRKLREILPYLEKAIALSKEYDIKGFATDLALFIRYTIYRNAREAYALLKAKIQKATDVPILSSTLHAIIMGLVIEVAAKYIPEVITQFQESEIEEKGEVILSRKIFEDMLLYGLSFANRKMPHTEYQEVIALLLGKVEKDNVIISELVPMTSGTEEEVQFQEEHYVKAAEINSIAAERNEFIVGWYHTHPTLGLFLSPTDVINQLGYQSQNEKAIAIVFDFNLMTPFKSGFAIFRLDDASSYYAAFHKVRWRIKDAPNNFYSEYFSFLKRFLSKVNHTIVKNKQMNLSQLAQELNYSEPLLQEIIPKLIYLKYLPNIHFNLETKIIAKKK